MKCDNCKSDVITVLAEFSGGRASGRFLGPCCHPALQRSLSNTSKARYAYGICRTCGYRYERCECDV